MIIGAHIFNSAEQDVFIDKRAKSKCIVYHCEFEECPLLAKGQCAQRKSCRPKCPYGKTVTEVGLTRRARGNTAWVNKRRAMFPKCPSTPPDKMVRIGDYVFLPYLHMDVVTGGLFVTWEWFTNGGWEELLTTIPLTLWDNVPIRGYREKILPLFKLHLKEVFGLGDGADVNPIGRLARLDTMTVGWIWYGWAWDGKSFTKENDRNSRLNLTGKTVHTPDNPSEQWIEVTNRCQVDEGTIYYE